MLWFMLLQVQRIAASRSWDSSAEDQQVDISEMQMKKNSLIDGNRHQLFALFNLVWMFWNQSLGIILIKPSLVPVQYF